MEWKIREFNDEDYETLTEVHNAVYPDYKQSAADWRRRDSLKEPKIKWQRWVAQQDGKIVAWGGYSHSSWIYHPRKLWVSLGVHPKWRRRGIGSALWETILAAARVHDPIVLRGDVREDMVDDHRFAAARGFTDRMREQESLLDLSAFDPGRFAADLERVEKQGILVRSYIDLAGDPDRDRKYHEMEIDVARDVPCPDPFTPHDFVQWRKIVLESPRFLPACNMIASDGDRYVGLSNLWQEETEGRLETGLTGVRREYRKRGIATALKVRALATARELGYGSTITWNEEKNRGMLGINERLGFQFRPAWIWLQKVLDAEALAESEAEAESKAEEGMS